MPRTTTKTKQTFDVKTVDTPSDLVAQTNLFDYSSLDANTAKLAKESAIEIKAREKAIWENIIEIGNRLIEVKNALKHGEFEEWVSKEFGWDKYTPSRYIKIAEEAKGKLHYSTIFPNSFKALYALASGLSKADEETKEEILTAVEEKTEEKGKALTEKEIKEIVAKNLSKVKEILSNPREAIKHTNKDLAEQFSLPLDVVSQARENIELKRGEEILKGDRTHLETKVKELEDKVKTHEKKESDLEKTEEELKKKEEQLNHDQELVALQFSQLNATIDDEANAKAKILAEQELKKHAEKLAKEREELEKDKAQINKELKDVENLKRTAQRQKDNLNSTQEWITNFQLTNSYLVEATNELKKYKKHLQKNPDLSELEEVDRLKVEEKIKNLIVDFNDNLHNLGGAINYLNGAVVKFNNYALRVIDAEVTDNE